MEEEKRSISSSEIEREIEREERKLSPVVETFKGKGKSVRVQERTPRFGDTARQYGQTIITGAIESVQPLTQPVYNSMKHGWNKFAPFRWFTYTLLTFYSVPIAIFIGWAVLCFAGVVALAGVGITIAEGFFLFLGMSVFIPVASVLCIVALGTVVLVTMAWVGMKFSITVYEYFNKPLKDSNGTIGEKQQWVDP